MIFGVDTAVVPMKGRYALETIATLKIAEQNTRKAGGSRGVLVIIALLLL